MSDDQNLLLRFQNGDEDALREMVSLHQRGLFLVALRMVRNEADAEELVQETFLRAHRGRDSFRGESSIKTWLYRILTNLTLNHIKKRQRETVEAMEDLEVIEHREGSLDRLLTEEQLKHTRDALETLPPRQKQVLVLRVYEDKSLQEIADILGSPLGTVKANLFHAIRSLRKRLAPLFPEEVKL